LAWAIASKLAREGADLAFTYQGEALERRVRPLAESVGSRWVFPCDVTREEDIDRVFGRIQEEWKGLDILIHSIAFAQREDLEGRFVETSRQGFLTALEISAYSLVSLARRAEPLMEGREGSLVTLSYYGS